MILTFDGFMKYKVSNIRTGFWTGHGSNQQCLEKGQEL